MKYRQYQINASSEVIKRLESGAKRILLHSPTASGKTIIGGRIVKDLPPKYKKVLFIVNKEALCLQTYEKFVNKMKIKSFITHNTITSDRKGNRVNKDPKGCKVLITLIGSRSTIPNDFKPDLIIIDEAHKGTSISFQDMVRDYDVPVIGLTATPHRAQDKDGESLFEWYGDNFLTTIPYMEMIEEKWLAPLNYHSLSEDAHVVETWKLYTKDSDNKRTILFTQNTVHSLEMKEAFLKSGISAEIITSGDEENVANQPTSVRNDIFNRFESGEIEVLISVMALCEGFDEPQAKFCFLCRRISSNNVALYHQMCGRVSRPHDSKTHGVVVDFHGNFDRFGSLEEYEYGGLDDAVKTIKVLTEGERISYGNSKTSKLMLRCTDCHHVYNVSEHYNCIHCGKRNKATVYSTLSDVQHEMLKNVDKEGFKKFMHANKYKTTDGMSRANAVKHYCEVAQRAFALRRESEFNGMWGEIFDPETLECKFPWMMKVTRKTKMDEVIEWEL